MSGTWLPIQVLVRRYQSGFAMDVQPHVPPGLAAVMRQCLAVEPAARPSATVVRQQLMRLAEDLREDKHATTT